MRNYVFYAIGEIILVMIGILFAVEINNLNKKEQKDALKLDILEEMISDLQLDAEDFKYDRGLHLNAQRSCQIIRNVLINDLSMHDSLKAHFSSAYGYTAILHKKGSYKILALVMASLLLLFIWAELAVGLFGSPWVGS